MKFQKKPPSSKQFGVPLQAPALLSMDCYQSKTEEHRQRKRDPNVLQNNEVTHIYRVYNWTARPTPRRPSRRLDGPPGVLLYRKTPARRLDGGDHRLDDTPVVWTAPLHWTEMTIGCTGQSSNWTARPTTPWSRPWAGRPVRRLDGHVHRRDGPPVGWTETFIGVDGPPVDHIGGMIHAPWLLLLHSGKAEQQDVQAFLPSFGESRYCTAHYLHSMCQGWTTIYGSPLY